ncbi:MAG TPA: fatty acid desaturase CarF family protein [Rhizomicrobium sp.]|nr:fatty acid desaturase CarF family protein [Rhizomicrobium sp.]
MSTLALPKSSRTVVLAAVIGLGVSSICVCLHDGGNLWLALVAVALSGFLADLFTSLAHFGFDYVFPEKTPILGPIASEFREHHDHPTLDPSDYVVNLSKGSYASLPLSVLVCVLCRTTGHDWGGFLLLATLLGMSFWAFFFHQIHSYAHMGSCIAAEEFKARVAQVRALHSRAEQTREFEKLFEAAPIPSAIRLLQRCRLMLNPKTHNFHHIHFETDFSSVNGWSDPMMNLVLKPIAKRIIAARAKQTST